MTLLLAVLTTATAWAAHENDYLDNSWYFRALNATQCTITGYTDASVKFLTIPKTLTWNNQTYNVYSVSSDCFSNFPNLQSISFYEDTQIEYMPNVADIASFNTIYLITSNGTVENRLPASITQIGNAFKNTSIKELTLPNVTSIGEYAFMGCDHLETVTFEKPASIGRWSFAKIKGYYDKIVAGQGVTRFYVKTTVDYPGPLSNWSTYNYEYSPSLVVKCNDGSCGWCGDEFGDRTGDNYYENASCLYWILDKNGNLTIDCIQQDIVLENYLSKQIIKTSSWNKADVKTLTLKRIYGFSNNCFLNYSNLTAVNISSFVNRIDLSSHVMHNIKPAPRRVGDVEAIECSSFGGCTALTSIVVDENNKKYDSRNECNAIINKDDNKLLVGCKNTTIPASVKIIGECAFMDCTTLTSLTIPEGVTDIYRKAFLGCTGLTSLAIPASVETIREYAFMDCEGLTSLTIHEGVTTLYWDAFSGCVGLTSLAIPASMTEIKSGAFSNCPNIETISVNENNPKYDSRNKCNAIIDTEKQTLVFGCKNTSIPEAVVSIDESAFEGCKNLPSVTLPAGLSNIWGSAFRDCSHLENLYFNGSKKQWDKVYKAGDWNTGVASNYTEHWRCTVTFDANGHGTAPEAQTGLWSSQDKVTEPAPLSADGYVCTGWFTDAACTTQWDFANDVLTDDLTLYADWGTACAATFTTAATTVEIPYGQEWTDIPVTASSLTLGFFQNEGQPVRQADAVAVTPFVGSGASSAFTFQGTSGTIDAYKGAGEHTVGNRISESLTAVGQSGTLWVYIPKAAWEAAAPGSYTQNLAYDAVFLSNAVTPAETYGYSLDNNAKVTLQFSVTDPVTLTFVSNNGVSQTSTVNTRKSIPTPLPVNTFTIPMGKTFLCWNTKADGTGNRYYVGSTIVLEDDMTLYAEWGEGCLIDFASATSQDITLGLSAQLTTLTGYFMNDDVQMGLDIDLDGVMDVEIVQEYDDASGTWTASVNKLKSLTKNYRFVLTTPSEEGEYGSVIFKFVNGVETVEQPAIELLYDDMGTYNREQLLTLKDGQQHNLMLSDRTFYRDGFWNTLCLPFAIANFDNTPLEGATVMELDTEGTYSGHKTGVDGSTLYLYFKEVTSIEADKPYIMKWTTTAEDLTNPVFYGVTVTAEAKDIPNPYRYSYDDPETITVAAPTDVTFPGGKFCGTYDPTVIYNDEHNKFFLGDDNTLYWPDIADYSIKAFRAYFDLSALPSGVRTFSLNFGDVETSLPQPLQKEGSQNAAWYTLDGRKLDAKPTKKGLYIVNGRKIIIK